MLVMVAEPVGKAVGQRFPEPIPAFGASPSNPNGSLDNIAGICNEGSNVLGMMPHPDRCSESLLGSADGAKIFRSMITAPVVTR